MAPVTGFLGDDGSSGSDEDGNDSHSPLATVEETAEEEGLEDMGIDDNFRSVFEKFQAVVDVPLEELLLPDDIVQEIQQSAEEYIKKTSRGALGDVVFDALIENVPYARKYFVTPRPILVMRFANALSSMIAQCGNPAELKRHAETLAFQHLEIEVTPPRFDVAREGVLNAMQAELGAQMTTKASTGFQVLLNYIGSSYIFVRREYGQRVRLILRSWRTANAQAQIPEKEEDEDGSPPGQENEEQKEKQEQKQDEVKSQDAALPMNIVKSKAKVSVPNGFEEMFLFNAAVMGYSESHWMTLVLHQFGAIASNCANSFRIQEECDVLSLVLAKYKEPVNLPEFKSVLLAALRSLVPKVWDMQHDAAWNWLWEIVETSLKANQDKPARYEKLLTRFLSELEEEQVAILRREVYTKFFEIAPTGQEFFKQSSTRLFFIADKIIFMTVEIFKNPLGLVEELSAIGLRHVGYGVPTELFPRYVDASVSVLETITTQQEVVEAYHWALNLVAKITVRVVQQGATIVMKAINTNERVALKKALSVSPRSERAQQLLEITVGTQSISPLYWAIESGALVCAEAMLEDLLTIRADRDVYYYGCAALFTRHRDVVNKLCVSAPFLLTTLLDGLVWRSRLTSRGLRRVNYYVKYLVQELDGSPSQALQWLVEYNDPKVICHEAVTLVSDVIWTHFAQYKFVLGRVYILVAVLLFITSQSILFRRNGQESLEENVVVMLCRLLVYTCSLGALLRSHIKSFANSCTERDFMRVCGLPLPQYLCHPREIGSLALVCVLLAMLGLEPIIWCGLFSIDGQDTLRPTYLFTGRCEGIQLDAYTGLSCFGVLLYWSLLLDWSIFSMRVAAFLLVIERVAGHIVLFFGALLFLVLMFSASITALNHHVPNYDGILQWLQALTQISLGMFPNEGYAQMQQDWVVMVFLFLFIGLVVIFLLNVLIAQLNESYHNVFEDMYGFARLNRANIIVAILRESSEKSFAKFLEGLNFEEKLEFNEGDVGMAGGMQITEPSNLHPITIDTVKRYGGSTQPSSPWPEEVSSNVDKFDKLEKLIAKITPRQPRRKKKGPGAASSVYSGSANGDTTSVSSA